MTKVLSFVLLSLMLSSCYVFETKLTVNNELKAYAFVEGQTEPGHLNEVTIAAGDYSGKFVSVTQEQLNFYAEIDGIKFYLPVNVPRSSFEGYGGKFKVTADKSGQPWGFKGQIIRSHYDSDPIQAVEECGYVVYVNVCRNVPEPDGTYRRVCRDEGHIKDGHQKVEYVERNINEHFKANILTEEGEDIGHFEGDRDTVKKIYSFQDTCS